MTSRRAVAIAASLAALLLVAHPAFAELTDDEAAKLFDDGLAKFDGGDPRAAAEIWERVLAEGAPSRSWRILYNLGLAYQAAGDRPRSLDRFEEFVRKVGEQPGQQPPEIEARRQDAVERANAIRPQLGRLRILRGASGERIAVRIATDKPRDAPFDQYVEPGGYDLEMGEGARAVRTRVELRAGQTVELVARLLPAPEPPPQIPLLPPPPRDPLVHPAVLIGGAALTAVSVALPVGLFFQAKSLRADAEAIPRVLPEYEDAVEKYEDFRTGYMVSWALPSVLGAATLSLLVATVVDSQEEPRATVRFGPAGATLAIDLE
ncbi:MAG: tetratricopeptide repeat protein [Polyangiaceae bacterium]|nr:tetratricopeptide repeat protein [Polyangiaceae bacterium]